MSTCIRQTAAIHPNSSSVLLSYFVAQYVLIIVIVFYVEKEHQNKDSLAMTDMTKSTELLVFKKDKRMVIKLLQKFSCAIVLFYCETNSKSSKIYLLATMKYTWCAYLSPPFIGISRHKSLQFVNKSNTTLLSSLFMIL